MPRRGWRIGGLVLASALVGLFVWRAWLHPIQVAAPEPLLTADLADTLTQVPRSVLIAPIAFDLGPAIAQFEADVPRQFGSLERRIRADSSARASVAFAASRSPFQVHVDGSQIVVETVLEYEGRGWYNLPLVPEVSAGCGSGDDPKPRLRLRIVSTPSFTREWGLHTQSYAEVARFSDEPRDQCQVTFLDIDVTGKVVDAVREEMTALLGRQDRRVARHDTRRRIERIWRKMEQPLQLTDGVWLLLQPGAANLASFSGAGDSLVALMHLEVRPKIVTGLRPADSTLVTPLPPLRMTADPDSAAALHVVLEGVFAYDAATSLLHKQLVGKVIRMAGRRLRIEDVTLRGIGSGRVALGVTFGGAVQGRVFFTGTPRLDLDARQLTFPDLDFDVGSADLLISGLSWWQGDAVRDLLRTNAVIPDSAALAKVERLAEEWLNRELTDGVRLDVALGDSRGLAVYARREHLIVRALAEGQARLAVDRVLARIGRRSRAHAGDDPRSQGVHREPGGAMIAEERRDRQP